MDLPFNKTILKIIERVFLLQVSENSFSHIRAHSSLPGFLAEGNARVNKLTVVVSNTLPNIFEQAKLSHTLFHQNTQALLWMLCISKSQAKVIINTCPNCQLVQPPISTEVVNPLGLPRQLWQMDLDKYPSFRKFKNSHVSQDTFPCTIFASVQKKQEKQPFDCQHFFVSIWITRYSWKGKNKQWFCIYNPKIYHIFNRLGCLSHF